MSKHENAATIQHLKSKAHPDSICVEYKHGATWNDGGHWYSAVFEQPDGSFVRVRMESDYNCNALDVTPVAKVMVATFEATK